MHSSYVSVKPHNLPVSNLPSSLPTTFPASDLRPNLSASNVLARHENKDAVVTEPSPHALHSQMIGSGKSNETPNSSERPFEPRPSSHTTHIATHNSSLVGPNSENAPPQNKPPVDVVESNFQQPTVESSNSKLQGYQVELLSFISYFCNLFKILMISSSVVSVALKRDRHDLGSILHYEIVLFEKHLRLVFFTWQCLNIT